MMDEQPTTLLLNRLLQLFSPLTHPRKGWPSYPRGTVLSMIDDGWQLPHGGLRLFVGTSEQIGTWLHPVLDTSLPVGRNSADQKRRRGVVEHFERFLRTRRHDPALIWCSPVWVRTASFAAQAGLVRTDETAFVERFSCARRTQNVVIPLKFMTGASFEIDARELAFFYPEAAEFLARTPRRRVLSDGAGRVTSVAYEEGIGLANPDEAASLLRGFYRPNAEFHRSDGGGRWKYLDLPTVTVASIMPRRMPAFESMNRGAMLGRGRRLWQSWKEVGDVEGALVRFLRLTFEPTDFRVVVLLGAERSFDRFLLEHAGMRQMLTEALT